MSALTAAKYVYHIYVQCPQRLVDSTIPSECFCRYVAAGLIRVPC